MKKLSTDSELIKEDLLRLAARLLVSSKGDRHLRQINFFRDKLSLVYIVRAKGRLPQNVLLWCIDYFK